MSKKTKKMIRACNKRITQLSKQIESESLNNSDEIKKNMNYDAQLNYFINDSVSFSSTLISLDKFLIAAIYVGFFCLFSFDMINPDELADDGNLLKIFTFILAIIGCITLLFSTIALWLNMHFADRLGTHNITFFIMSNDYIDQNETERMKYDLKREEIIKKISWSSNTLNATLGVSICFFIATLILVLIQQF